MAVINHQGFDKVVTSDSAVTLPAVGISGFQKLTFRCDLHPPSCTVKSSDMTLYRRQGCKSATGNISSLNNKKILYQEKTFYKLFDNLILKM